MARMSIKINTLLIICFLSLPIKETFADSPFFTDSAVTFEPHQWQLILYGIATQAKYGRSFNAPAIELDFGVVPDLEIDTLTPFVIDVDAPSYLRKLNPNASGLGDILVELKYRLVRETSYLPHISFAPNFFLPTGNGNRGLGNGRFWYYLPLTFEKNFGATWRTYIETGYAFNSAPTGHNHFIGGWALQRNINKKLMIGGEIFTQGKSYSFIPAYTLLNIGFVYNFNDHVSFQASAGHSVFGLAIWSAYAGVGWA